MSAYRPNRFRTALPPGTAALPAKKAAKKRVSKPAAPLPPGSLTADTLTIIVPVPPVGLRPNGDRAHWRTVGKLKRAAKALASLLTRSLAGPSPTLRPTGYSLIYHTRNRWDEDNAIASVKSHLDGIAASLGVNDRGFHFGGFSHVPERECPRVEIVMHLTTPTVPTP